MFCTSCYIDFLLVHIYYCFEDTHGWGIPEGFIYLCFSSCCSFHILWDCHHHVLTAQLQSFPGHRQNRICVLYYAHPHVESCGLQPEEQRGQECIQKGCWEDKIFSRFCLSDIESTKSCFIPLRSTPYNTSNVNGHLGY